MEIRERQFNEAKRTLKLSYIELVLRSLKMSFGFVNSMTLIVLMKPFHEPLFYAKNSLLKQFGRTSTTQVEENWRLLWTLENFAPRNG